MGGRTFECLDAVINRYDIFSIQLLYLYVITKIFIFVDIGKSK